MSNKMPVRSRIVLVFSILFVLSVMVPTSFAGKNSEPLVVVDYTAQDARVYVYVKNLTHKAQTAYVVVEATVNGMTLFGLAPVTVSSTGVGKTVIGFTGTVETVETVGINESGGPL